LQFSIIFRLLMNFFNFFEKHFWFRPLKKFQLNGGGQISLLNSKLRRSQETLSEKLQITFFEIFLNLEQFLTGKSILLWYFIHRFS